MSTLFLGHYVQFFDDNGDPLSGGKVDFYEPGTSTPKDVYTDSGLSTPDSNPVTLDSAGRATVWLNGDYKVRLKNSAGTVIRTTDNINPPEDAEVTSGNLIANGSFETQGTDATDADGWTLTAQSDGVIERVTTDNYDGSAALKITSDGSGGGQADTNAFFAVSPGRTIPISFALKCSVADIRNIVQVRYYDEDQSFLSNSTIYDEASSNPTSWTVKRFTDTPPANARFAKLRIIGADQSDMTPGEAKFDSVRVDSESRFPNVDGEVTATTEELNRASEELFTGKTEPWFFSSLPNSGWLFVNGETIGDTGSGADHEGSELESLFDLIKAEGSTYGNSGSEVFANGDTVSLPDTRDRSLLGAATMGTSDAGRVSNYSTGLGDTGGEDEHQLTNGEMPSHNHGGSTGNGGNHSHALRIRTDVSGTSSLDDVLTNNGLNFAADGGTIETTGNNQTSNSGTHSHSISNAGSDSAHNNMHPFMACNWIIKI